MTRRDSLKIFGLLSGAAALPGLALLRPSAGILIYDGRFTQGRELAQTASQAFDCQADAASTWFTHVADFAATTGRIEGLTTSADAMIIADCARRDGFAFRQGKPSPTNGLTAWSLSGKT